MCVCVIVCGRFWCVWRVLSTPDEAPKLIANLEFGLNDRSKGPSFPFADIQVMCDGHRDSSQCQIFLRPRTESYSNDATTALVEENIYNYRYGEKLISIVVKCVRFYWDRQRQRLNAVVRGASVWACTINTTIAMEPVLLHAIHFPIHTLRLLRITIRICWFVGKMKSPSFYSKHDYTSLTHQNTRRVPIHSE